MSCAESCGYVDTMHFEPTKLQVILTGQEKQEQKITKIIDKLESKFFLCFSPEFSKSSATW